MASIVITKIAWDSLLPLWVMIGLSLPKDNCMHPSKRSLIWYWLPTNLEINSFDCPLYVDSKYVMIHWPLWYETGRVTFITKNTVLQLLSQHYRVYHNSWKCSSLLPKVWLNIVYNSHITSFSCFIYLIIDNSTQHNRLTRVRISIDLFINIGDVIFYIGDVIWADDFFSTMHHAPSKKVHRHNRSQNVNFISDISIIIPSG